MNIFMREMKAYRKSLIIWCIGVILMVVAGMSKYSALGGSGQSINDIVLKMPKSLQAVIGVGTLDLSKASGYYGVLFLYLAIMATIHAAMLGSNIISKEEGDKTAEFLMVKPISRNRIITSKLLAALSNIAIFNIVTLITSISTVGRYGKGEAVSQDIIILMIAMFILQLMFLVIGIAIAAISKNPKTATSISTGILLSTFILSILSDINSKFENLKYITPFKYYEAKKLMYGGGFEYVFVVLSIVIIGFLLSVTYIFYKNRDLNV
ncbi:MAG: ABC transporter permease subunit [Clostridiaceae bacterium]